MVIVQVLLPKEDDRQAGRVAAAMAGE